MSSTGKGVVLLLALVSANALLAPSPGAADAGGPWYGGWRVPVDGRVDVDGDGQPADAFSGLPELSLDGRYVAFVGNHLTPDDATDEYDVYRRDLSTGVTQLVSVSTVGTQDTTNQPYYPSLSGNGRFVSWGSQEALVAGDTNGHLDTYVHDVQTGVTVRASVTTAEEQASSEVSCCSDLSDDGRYVLFQSTSLAFGNVASEGVQVFLRDLVAGTTELVSRPLGTDPTDAPSSWATLSGDGRHVAFLSDAGNLAAGGGHDDQADLFVRDLDAGTTRRVFRPPPGGEVSGTPFPPVSLSADGGLVAFTSHAPLVPGAPLGSKVYVRNVTTGATIRADISSAGVQGEGSAGAVDLSADGRYVAFRSHAAGLVPGEGYDGGSTFVHNLSTRRTEHIDVAADGSRPPGDSGVHLSIAGDGSAVAFWTSQASLVPDFVPSDGPGGLYVSEAQPSAYSDVSWVHPFVVDITWMADNALSTGFPDGTFRPGASVTRASMAAFMHRLAGEPPFAAPATASFVDVSTTHPFFTEIEWLASEGITSGYAGGLYRPAAAVTRQSMSAFLHRLAGEPPFAAPATASFVDVSITHPFFTEIEWLVSEGITAGYADGLYKPAAAVTRQSMSAFLHRLADGPGVDLDP